MNDDIQGLSPGVEPGGVVPGANVRGGLDELAAVCETESFESFSILSTWVHCQHKNMTPSPIE